jgi:UDP-N-acetylmuramoyl-tripeptide--D-alanyl-D-alanine ligase
VAPEALILLNPRQVQWTPVTLAQDAAGTLARRGSRPIAGIFIDSRTLKPGALFVPIVAVRDGHDFIPMAVSAGATAVLVQRGRSVPPGDFTVVEVDDTLQAMARLARCRRERFEGPVVAITGSNGKTTTRSMIAAVLERGFAPVLCTRGNLNNHLGVPLTLLDAPQGPRAMVVELGMNAVGENDRLAAIVQPTVHVITSIALEHLEFMGTIEAIAAAEAEPVAHVRAGGVVIVPSDEPLLTPHLRGSAGLQVIRFGPDASADVRIERVEQGERTVADIRLRSGVSVTVHLRVFGIHNARNAAAALAVGEHLGIAAAPMVAALESVDPVGDRGRLVAWGEHVLIADCYNANPGSVAAALHSLAALRTGRPGPRVAVLGDMLELGPREAELHAAVGTEAASLGLDAVIGLGDRMRHAIDSASEAGIEALHFDDDIDAAVAWLWHRFAGAPAGAVLIKGSRGMQLERVIDALTRV